MARLPRRNVEVSDVALGTAIQAYHALLDDHGAAESWGFLGEQLTRRGLWFGERPLCNVLRPRFLSPAGYDVMRRSTTALLRAFDTLYRAALADSALRAQFHLTPIEEQLIGEDHGLWQGSVLSRLDAFFTADGHGVRFTEYNGETPAGAAYCDVLTELFHAMPVMRTFQRHWHTAPLPARHHTVNALLDGFAKWCGSREAPRVVILDWKEVPTYHEFVLFKQFFEELGIECVIADPRDCEYKGGVLYADGNPVNLIYKRVLISELLERGGGLEQPVVRAVREKAACLMDGFRCKMLHKKASLAVLSDERNAHLFSASEQHAISETVPWTRVVEERKSQANGRVVDLIPYIHAHRERMVLKPNDEYGGTGIVLGWEVSDTQWEAAVGTALASPHVVQERIHLPSEPFPSSVEGKLVIADRIVDTAPFCFDGVYTDGCLSRISTATLVNVTAGGGSTVPTFIVEPR